MSVTIQDRRVTWIPAELEPQLQLESCCATCKTTMSKATLRKCSSCKLVFYCGRDCQAQDWQRHKTQEDCSVVKKLRRRLGRANEKVESSALVLMRHFSIQYGEEDDFLGKYMSDETFGRIIRGRGSFNVHEDDREEMHEVFNMIDLVAGRFGDDNEPITTEVIRSMRLLFEKVVETAERLGTRSLWELALEIAVELKRISHVALPDLIDETIPSILLKLHRDDDAIGYIKYWMNWRPQAVIDYDVIWASKGDWPFPCAKDCRFLDLSDDMRNCYFEDERLWFLCLICCYSLGHQDPLRLRVSQFVISRRGLSRFTPRTIASD